MHEFLWNLDHHVNTSSFIGWEKTPRPLGPITSRCSWYGPKIEIQKYRGNQTHGTTSDHTRNQNCGEARRNPASKGGERTEGLRGVWHQKRKPSRTSHALALLACRNWGTKPEFMFPTFINYLQSIKRWQQFLPLHPLSNEGWRTKRLGGRIAQNLEVFPMDDRIIHGMIIVFARFCPMMALSLHACWTKSPTHLPQGCTHYKIQFDLAVMLF